MSLPTTPLERLRFRVGYYRRQAARARRGEVAGTSAFYVTQGLMVIDAYRDGRLEA